MELTQWDSIYDVYKRGLVKLIYNIASDNMPAMISDLVVWHNSPYNLKGHNRAVVPRFSTYFMKKSVCYRGAVLWHCVSEYFMILVILNNFIQRQNLVRYLGKSDLR